MKPTRSGTELRIAKKLKQHSELMAKYEAPPYNLSHIEASTKAYQELNHQRKRGSINN